MYDFKFVFIKYLYHNLFSLMHTNHIRVTSSRKVCLYFVPYFKFIRNKYLSCNEKVKLVKWYWRDFYYNSFYDSFLPHLCHPFFKKIDRFIVLVLTRAYTVFYICLSTIWINISSTYQTFIFSYCIQFHLEINRLN